MNLKSEYSFDVDLDYPNSRISVNQTVKITNKSNDRISTLNFSVIPKAFNEFNLRTVQIDGKDADYKWTNNANLAVNLPEYIDPDAKTVIVISFLLTPKANIKTYLKSSLSKANGIMQLSNWFPILSNGHPMRMPGDSQYSVTADSFHMELKLNKDYPVAAPGNITSPTPTKRVVDFGPARNFVFSVCPDCVVKTDTIDGIKVKVYFIPGRPGGKALNTAVNAIKTFNSRFINYPYDTYIVAQGTRAKTATEFPGMVFVGGAWLGSAKVVRHETAHQWFYGMLGNDQMEEPWLDEAFAEWAGLGFKAHSYCSPKKVSSSIYDFPNKYDYYDYKLCGSYDQTVYYKGSELIQGVRERMGDAAFFASLNDLFKNRKFGVINTSIVATNWLDYAPNGTKKSLRTYMEKFISW